MDVLLPWVTIPRLRLARARDRGRWSPDVLTRADRDRGAGYVSYAQRVTLGDALPQLVELARAMRAGGAS